MKKMVLVNLGVILIVLMISAAIFFWSSRSIPVSEEFAKCVGERAAVYIQNGCIHCINQEKLFGENFKFVNYVNCTDDWALCSQIPGTPTWIVDGKQYVGIQSIDKLKNLTGC